MAKEFFNTQTDLTAAKISVFKHYIQGYLPKLLMSFGNCLIVDLFCDAGKNGNKNGSPLVLIDSLNYILSSPLLTKKNNVNVEVLFNDQNQENINNLKTELNNTKFDSSIISIQIENENYESILPNIIKKLKKNKIPKFFFLDPFTYANIKISDLSNLMELPFAEVLLFIPIFHTYRFSNAQFKRNHKTRIFIEEYTSKGVTDYENIDAFLNSIKEKLIQELSLKYVRPVLLDDGGKKNALFLLTKHQKGMLLMNKVAFNLTKDGNRVQIKNQDQYSLFQSNEASNFYSKFAQKLIATLQKQKMTNKEIVDFTIIEGCLPKQAKEELKSLYNTKKIKVFDNNNIEIKDSRKWNIADETNKTTIFKWFNN